MKLCSALLFLLTILGLGACGWRAEPPAASAVARGKYLADAYACADCHTPWRMGEAGPEPDPRWTLSGHPAGFAITEVPETKAPWLVAATATNTAWAGPWGVSFSANLTPDPETGLGRWTARNFVDAMRSGRHMGNGRPILPPMPAAALAKLTDTDLEAIFAYLQSVPPIRNEVPAPLSPPSRP